MKTDNDYNLEPGVGNSFRTGWRVMADNFLRLLLLAIIMGIVTAPMRIGHNFNISDFQHLPMHWFHWGSEWPHTLFNIGAFGIFAAFFGLLMLLYAFLVQPVFIYGKKMIYVLAVRRNKPDFEYLVKGFMENYLHIVLANLLVFALVMLGSFALIIPGIIIGCRLAFVSYIIMDKKLDPIEAVELSWKLTKGHGWKVFFMGLLSFFIIIFGFALLIVGVFPASIWVSGSFASLYESVLKEKEDALIQPEVTEG